MQTAAQQTPDSTTQQAPQTPAVRRIVAVTDDVPTGAVGSIAYWKLGTKTNAEDLERAWTTLGLVEVLGKAPTPPTPEVALSRALADQKAKRKLVRPLAKAKEGYAVVLETVEEGKDPEYQTLVKVRLNEALKPVFDPPTSDLAVEIRQSYREHLNTLLASDLSEWLVDVMTKLEAVALKPTGGVYFVPAHKADLLSKVVKAVREGGGSVVYEIPAMDSEAATLAFVDAITTEAKATCEAVLKELTEGGLGARALDTRSKVAADLSAKIERYEKLLGTRLDDLKQQVMNLAGAVSAASLAAAAD